MDKPTLLKTLHAANLFPLRIEGHEPTTNDILSALLMYATDSEAIIRGAPESTWNERRIARLSLIIVFLLVLAQE